jgi:hypothetical protein
MLGIAHLFGLSTQDTDYQREAWERLHLPFPLLSDEQFCLALAMQLPTFDTAGMKLLKRITLVIHDGLIQHTFYPVFPPDQCNRRSDMVQEPRLIDAVWIRRHEDLLFEVRSGVPAQTCLETIAAVWPPMFFGFSAMPRGQDHRCSSSTR